jgi:hypothetical protein
MKPQYTIPFMHQGRCGMVHVFPACAYVNWAGMSFTVDDCGPALALSILRANLKR